MDQGFLAWLDTQQGRPYELHDRYINPAFVKMIRTIGFDKNYIREWLFDAEGRRYLDLLTGWGIFALGRNHPRVRPANAARLGAKAIAKLKEMGRGCPFVYEVRGKGLMFGIDFRRPEGEFKLKAAWDPLHLLNEGVFSQTVIVPLLREHRMDTGQRRCRADCSLIGYGPAG